MKGIKTDRLYVYLGYLFLVTSLVTGVTFSRYSVTISNLESQNVITLKTINKDFDVKIEKVTEELVFDEQAPGMKEQKFIYQVKNNTKEEVYADIDITWKDSENKMNIPLEFKVYRENKKIFPKRGKYKSSNIGLNKIRIEAEEIAPDETVEYTIRWNWDEEDNGYILAGKKTDININIEVEPKDGDYRAQESFELIAKSSNYDFIHDGYSKTIGIEKNEAYIDIEVFNYKGKEISEKDIKYYISIEDEYGENKKFDLKVDNVEYIRDKTKEYKLKGNKKKTDKKRIYFVVSPDAVGTLNVVENVRVKVTTVEPYAKESIFNVFITNDSLIKFRLEDWFTLPLATRRLKFQTNKTFEPMVDTGRMLVELNWDNGLDIDMDSKYIKKNKNSEYNKNSIINGGKLREYYIEIGTNDVVGIDFFENGITHERGIDVKTYLIRDNGKLLNHTDWNFN